MNDFFSRLHTTRQEHYGQGNDPILHSVDDMAQYINHTGFCLLFPHRQLLLPNIWQITEGQPWRWKDDLPARKLAYYGKRFRGRVGFISPKMLPAIYALSPTAAFQGERFELYRHDYISAEANRLTGIVLAKGPLSTRDLRRAVGMIGGRPGRYGFHKVLAEAERNFLITKVGSVPVENNFGFTHLWDGFERFWSDALKTEVELSHAEAGHQVIAQYIKAVTAATAESTAYALSLTLEFVDHIIEGLLQKGELVVHRHEETDYYFSPEHAEALLG